MRGWSPPVFDSRLNAFVTTPPQPVYVTLPNATIPTPYSGSHCISEP